MIQNKGPAELGSIMVVIVSATIMCVTNNFHGDIWEYLRNKDLNANSWSNNFNHLPVAALRWNMFGATLGGPIIKNKLFFFVDYQGQRFDTPTSQSTTNVYTSAERGGDFSALCPAGFTPAGICSSTKNGNVQLYNPSVSSPQICTPSSPPPPVRHPLLN